MSASAAMIWSTTPSTPSTPSMPPLVLKTSVPPPVRKRLSLSGGTCVPPKAKLWTGFDPLPGVADDADRYRARQADVLYARAGRDDGGVLQDRQHGRHVPQSRFDRLDHVIDVFGAVERGIDVRLDAAIADPG